MTNFFKHETAIVETDAENIGEGTKIWAFVHICKNAKIGKNCTIGEGVYIGSGVIIGDNSRIQNRALLYTGVEIGEDVFIGPGVVTTNDFFPTLPVGDWSERFKKTIIKNKASIGANSTIVCGVTIGESSMAGAGSVITKDMEDGYLYFGNSAKKIKKIV